jgi:abhydrolase domain-containing protein 11
MTVSLPTKQAILPVFHHIAHAHSTPIVFLHGFLGSKKNFTHISKKLAKQFNASTYSFDARNHGDSLHCLPMTYPAMTNDLATLLNHEKIPKVTLVGYSMGAKTAMNYTLNHPEKVERLVCIDNAPVVKPIGDEFYGYIDALVELLALDWSHFDHRSLQKKLRQELRRSVSDENLVLYLLANVSKFKNRVVSKIPLEIMDESVMKALGDFPTHNTPVEVPTMFIKASKSGFIDENGMQECKKLFTNCRIETLDSDHANILVEQYASVKALVDDFLVSSYTK